MHYIFSALLLSLYFWPAASAGSRLQENTNAPEAETSVEVADDQGNVIEYGPDFFAQYPNAITIGDVIQRIPAGQAILNSGSSGRRGFSSNDDKILIDGKRQSSKSNNGLSTILSRITVDQVAKVQIIRGSSPDIKVSSSEGVINIVLNENASSGGSGTWLAFGRTNKMQNFNNGGEVTYSDTIGNLELFVSGGYFEFDNPIDQQEAFFDGNNVLQSELVEEIDEDNIDYSLKANLIYSLGSGDQIRLNGSLTKFRRRTINDGILFDAVGQPTGESNRFFRTERPQFEIGGDYETNLSASLKLKILGLWKQSDDDARQSEDFDIANGTIEEDFLFLSDSRSTEKIGRTSVTWQINPAHQLELGTEFAVNRLDSKLELLERQNGTLVPVDISTADTIVKETRNESFAIHSWKLSNKVTIDTQVFTEWSEIKQTAIDLNRKRTFFFARPSVDFRYAINPEYRLQLAVRRNIGQLNFGDFASSANDDDQVDGGNTELEPEKDWEFEASLERQLANDGGRLKLVVTHKEFQDKLDRVEVSPGISGVGNVGRGRGTRVEIQGSIRMRAIGAPNLLLEPRMIFRRTRLQDQFTGRHRPFSNVRTHFLDLTARHDIPSLGLAYGFTVSYQNATRFNDIDELIIRPNGFGTRLFIEKKLFANVVFRMDVFNLHNSQRGRDRLFFDDLIAGGVLTSRVLRDQRLGQVIDLNLRGTF